MTPPERRTSSGGFPALAVALLLLTVYTFCIALVPIRADNDIWWHLKSGKYISENGLPANDVFNFNAENLPWHNHEWLTQVLYWRVWQAAEATTLGGFRGVILFVGVMIWLTTLLVFFLARRLSNSTLIALFIAVLSLAIGRRMFYPRPPIVTNLLLMVELWILIGVTEGWWRPRALFILPPMIALWSNLHGGWMAGGLLLAVWTGEQVVFALRDKLPPLPFQQPQQFAGWRTLLIVLTLCLLATFCNPNGWHLYALPGRVMKDQYLVSLIGELRPPDLYYVVDFLMAVIGFFALALLTKKFRPGIFELFIYAFFLWQAFQHVRHLSFFAIMFAPLGARILRNVCERLREDFSATAASRKFQCAGYCGVGFLTAYLGLWVIINPREGGWSSQHMEGFSVAGPLTQNSYPGRNFQLLNDHTGYDRSRFPAELCDFIELADLRGNMFNENNYAGYLIWRLSPERKVFSDPRFDIFGGTILRREVAIAGGAPTNPFAEAPKGGGEEYWAAEVKKSNIQWLIVRDGSGLQAALNETTGWTRVFHSLDLAIWIQSTPENAEMIERAKNAALTFGPRNHS
ncbi:hypothetical protein BH09SUM1_BH09SUM1_14650 [soil metagenome]